jgi:hypothetical protein
MIIPAGQPSRVLAGQGDLPGAIAELERQSAMNHDNAAWNWKWRSYIRA